MPGHALMRTRRLMFRVAVLTAIALTAFIGLAAFTALRGSELVLAIEAGNAESRGTQLEKAGRLRAAAVEYYRLLEIQPGNQTVRVALTELQLRRGETAEALELAETLCGPEGDPSAARHQALLGAALFMDGRDEDAARAYDAALALQPSHPDALYGLAVIAASAGRLDEARVRFEALKSADMTLATRWYTERIRGGEELEQRYRGGEGEARLARRELVRYLEWHLKHGRLEEALAIYRSVPEWKTRPDEEPVVAALSVFEGESE